MPSSLLVPLLLCAVAAVTHPAFADPQPTEVLELSFALMSPTVDGQLDDPCWRSRPRHGGFITNWPDPGKAPSMPTEVQACYDHEALYFSFRCHDSEPGAIQARIANRDAGGGSDLAYVIIDTDAEGSTAYLFSVGAAGTRGDAHLTDDGLSVDRTWDAEWSAAATVHDEGWNAEIAVPFRELRFTDGEAPRCALNFGRMIHRLNEESLLSRPRDGEAIVKLVDARPVTGLSGPFNTGRIALVPTAASRSFSSPAGEALRTETELGISAKVRIGSAMVLDAALNPDFGEISADPNYVNLSRYETYYAERRPLFSERNDLFDTPFQLFYSRRIGKKLADGELVPILFGTKLTGKVDRYSIAAVHSITERTSYVSPWTGESTEPRAQYSVFRIARDFGEGSDVGATLTHAGGGSRNETVVGGDTYLELSRDWNFEGQVAESVHEGASGLAAYGKLRFYDAARAASLSYRHVATEFSASELGYVPWAGQDRWTGSAFLTPHPMRLGIRTLSIGSKGSFSRYEGDPRWSWSWNPGLSVTTLEQWSGWIDGDLSRTTYFGEVHDTRSVVAGVGSNPTRALMATLSAGAGNMIDYTLAERVDFRSVSLSSTANIGRQLTVDTNIYRMWERPPGAEEIDWTTVSIRPRYSVSDRTYFQLYAQGVDATSWGSDWRSRAWLDLNALACLSWRHAVFYAGLNRSGTWREGEWALLTKVAMLSWL